MKIVSVVTYNVKSGCADDFIAAFDAPGGISNHANYQQLIQVSDTHFISITEVDGVDEATAKIALYKASAKLPIKTKFIKRFNV